MTNISPKDEAEQILAPMVGHIAYYAVLPLLEKSLELREVIGEIKGLEKALKNEPA